MTDNVERRFLPKAAPGVALAGALPSPPAHASAAAGPAAPSLEYALRLHVLIGAPQEMGMVNGVRKRVIPITGGTVDGPRLQGGILPGGADWQSIRADGTAELFARYSIEATDGTIISVTNAGCRHGPAPVLARIAAGDEVDPALYYFRTAPRFEVSGDSPHGWMGRTLFLCTAARFRDHVRLDVFAVN